MGLTIAIYETPGNDETVWIDNPEVFAEHQKPFEAGKYSVRTIEYCHVGSYTGWKIFREELAQLAGKELVKDYWNNPDPTLPWYWLLNFSDCDGVIGWERCREMLEDFEKHAQLSDKPHIYNYVWGICVKAAQPNRFLYYM